MLRLFPEVIDKEAQAQPPQVTIRIQGMPGRIPHTFDVEKQDTKFPPRWLQATRKRFPWKERENSSRQHLQYLSFSIRDFSIIVSIARIFIQFKQKGIFIF